jgi:hypothetical protein
MPDLDSRRRKSSAADRNNQPHAVTGPQKHLVLGLPVESFLHMAAINADGELWVDISFWLSSAKVTKASCVGSAYAMRGRLDTECNSTRDHRGTTCVVGFTSRKWNIWDKKGPYPFLLLRGELGEQNGFLEQRPFSSALGGRAPVQICRQGLFRGP